VSNRGFWSVVAPYRVNSLRWVMVIDASTINNQHCCSSFHSFVSIRLSAFEVILQFGKEISKEESRMGIIVSLCACGKVGK
jgi:hypothetical protein